MDRIAEAKDNGFTATLYRGNGEDSDKFWICLAAQGSREDWITHGSAGMAWGDFVRWSRMMSDRPQDV